MVAAIRTRFRCRCPPPDLAKILFVLLALECKDRNELRERQIRNLSPPETLHASNVQRLGGYQVKSFAKVMSQLPMPIFSLPGNLTIQACKAPDNSMPVTRTFDFATQRLVEVAEFGQGLFQKLRRCDFLTVTQGQIRLIFDPEINPNFLTCRLHRFGLSEIGRQNQPVGTTVIALDRDLSDSPFPWTMFVKGIPNIVQTPFASLFVKIAECDPDTIRISFRDIPPSNSRIRERFKLVFALNMRTTAFLFEKSIVCLIDPLKFRLHSNHQAMILYIVGFPLDALIIQHFCVFVRSILTHTSNAVYIPYLKVLLLPTSFFVVYVAGGAKRWTSLQVRQKVRKCWKYPLTVATPAIRRSLRGDHQTDAPRIHRVWRSKGRLGKRWVFSWGKCGSCGSEHKVPSTHFPSPFVCNLPLRSAG